MLFFTTLGLTVTLVLGIAFYVLLIVANWKIFEKAGEAGWKSIIPIYSTYIVFKITWNTKVFWATLVTTIAACALQGQEGVLLYVCGGCALAALILLIMDMYKMAKAFGHGIGYTLGLIFLPNIFTLILGFGGDQYLGPQ